MSRLGRAAAGFAGRNAWLRERVPALGFVQKDVRRIWPGETIDDALNAAIDLHVLGIRTLYTWLPGDPGGGPAAPTPTDPDPDPDPDAAGARADAPRADAPRADAALAEYRELLARLAAAEIDGELSVTPADLGLDEDEDACFTRLAALAAAAEAQGSWLWLEMGGSGAVDRTLDLHGRLRASHRAVGVCLQANLRRTPKDVERLLPLDPAIRLVKGSHAEPKDVAVRGDREIDAAYMATAVTLLRESRTRDMRLVLATHDVDLVGQIATHATAAGVGKDRYAIQMRYGVRAREQRRLARAGYGVQTLIAYGPGWYPWYVGLLGDRPASALGTLRAVLPG